MGDFSFFNQIGHHPRYLLNWYKGDLDGADNRDQYDLCQVVSVMPPPKNGSPPALNLVPMAY